MRVSWLPTSIDLTKTAESGQTSALRVSKHQFIHAVNLARSFDHYYSGVRPVIIDGIPTVDFSTPKQHFYYGLNMLLEMPSFTENISMESWYFKWGQPKLGDTVFDLGANIGICTIFLANAVGPLGLVVAVEPDPINFAALEKNIRSSGAKNVRLLQSAVSVAKGRAEFFADGTAGSGLKSDRGASITTHPEGDIVSVETTTLIDIARQYGIPTYIKLDIEGSEIGVLEHSRSWLSQHRPLLVIDTDHIVENATTEVRVANCLAACNFTTHFEVATSARPAMLYANPSP